MKTNKTTLLVLFATTGIFLLGWYFGQKSATKLASNVVQMIMFDHAYSQIAVNQVAIELLDSGQIENAKNTISLNTDGNILALNNILNPSNSYISYTSMKILLKMDQESRNHYGSTQETSDKLLARVARYRAEHPWKYSSGSTTTNDLEIKAKLAAILDQAAQNQKNQK